MLDKVRHSADKTRHSAEIAEGGAGTSSPGADAGVLGNGIEREWPAGDCTPPFTDFSIRKPKQRRKESITSGAISPYHTGPLQTGAELQALTKLPELDVLYWAMKILASSLGETFASMISSTMGESSANSALIFFGMLVFTLAIQFYTTRYFVSVYWFVIMSTSLMGTCLSDFMNRAFHLGFLEDVGIFLGILILVFMAWKLSGQSFSVTGSMTRRAELLYWITIIVSNNLGTALGDFTSNAEIGFGGNVGLYGGLMVLTAVLGYFTRISRVFLFWVWFILTRPLGATCGDVLTNGTEKGGMGLGWEIASAIFAGPLIFLMIIALEKTRVAIELQSFIDTANAPIFGQGTFSCIDGSCSRLN
jgi:uncharacterized membrane-anchored protein